MGKLLDIISEKDRLYASNTNDTLTFVTGACVKAVEIIQCNIILPPSSPVELFVTVTTVPYANNPSAIKQYRLASTNGTNSTYYSCQLEFASKSGVLYIQKSISLPMRVIFRQMRAQFE